MERVLSGLEGPDKVSPASIIHNPVAGTRFTVRAGEQVTGVFEVDNDTTATADFYLDLAGLKGTWCASRIGQDACTQVTPFNSGRLTLNLAPPANAPPGNYDFTVRIVRAGPVRSDGTAVGEPVRQVPLVLSVTGAARREALPAVPHVRAKPTLHDALEDAAGVNRPARARSTQRQTVEAEGKPEREAEGKSEREAEGKSEGEAVDLPSEMSVRNPENGRTLMVRPGETQLLLFDFMNDTDHARTYAIYEDRTLPHDWIKFERNRVHLTQHKGGHVSLRLTPPLNARPGSYPFMVQIGPEDGELTPRHLKLRVLATPAVLLSAPARKIHASQFRRSVDFNLLVESAGNADTAFRLAIDEVEGHDGSYLLGVGDLHDPRGLMAKLQDAGHLVSAYLCRHSPVLQQCVQDYRGSTLPSRRRKKLLVNALNELLRGECLYQEAAFHEVRLSAETKRRLGKHQQARRLEGQGLLRLNRLLLEDAYPQEIARHTALIRQNSSPGRQDVYETAEWRYLFDRELDSLESAVPNRPPLPRPVRLRLVRKGIWWYGRHESHTVSVYAVPVTDPTNGGKTGNRVALTAVRRRLNPVPVSTLLPLLLIPLLIFASKASRLEIKGMTHTMTAPDGTAKFVTPVTYTGHSAAYTTSYIVGIPGDPEKPGGGKRIKAHLTWKARPFALLRVSDNSADDSKSKHPFVTRGPHEVYGTFKDSQVSINSFYEINRLIGFGGPMAKVKYVAARDNTNLVVETANVETAHRDRPLRFTAHRGTVDGEGIEEIPIWVPSSPNTHAILKLTNLTSKDPKKASSQDNALYYWVAERDSLRPVFTIKNLNNEGSLRPVNIYPQAAQMVTIKWTDKPPGQALGKPLVLITTDAKRPVLRLLLKRS